MNPSSAALSIVAPGSPQHPRSKTLRLPFSTGLHRPLALVAIGVAAWSVVLAIDALHGVHLHAPRLRLLLALPWVLQLHIAAAVSALGLGLALMMGVKGRTFHRRAGWIWVGCMMTVAVSSFWIRDHGHLGFIHFLSGWTGIAVPMGVAAIKRGDLKGHRTAMTRTFMGGLIIAGAFTFVPGRLMWQVFLG